MYEETIQKVIKYNTPEKNIMKVIEECTELNEVLIKTLTKREEDKPGMSKIVEEAGDVIARLKIMCSQMGINHQVNERVMLKMHQLDKWMDEKYKGTV